MEKYVFIVKDEHGIELFRDTNEMKIRYLFYFSPKGSTCTKEKITVDEDF